ncbi:MAG TPA: metallophosphoesterase [Flavisolibacter sp.]|nr:metallophosphoesterase [Flavisolibacter sp.]
MSFWLRKLLFKPVLWASNKFSSRPDRLRIFKALSDLHDCIIKGENKKGPVIPFDSSKDRFIIFSDQHKGAKNGADDFMLCEPNYLAALDYYYERGYFFIALGDCEELWENTLSAVKSKQQASFEREKKFFNTNRGIKIFGNHDLYWQNDPFAHLQLKEIFGCDLPIYEGALLQTQINNNTVNIFCTHGHQGDAVSDGNWFSKFFVSKIWAPLQALLKINPNTPAYDAQLKTVHNTLMYDWSAAQKNLFLITGHTHQPVFESLTHIEHLYRQLLFAEQAKDQGMTAALEKEIQLRKFEYTNVSRSYLEMKPSYFNSGCCCFSDGDITGIEIESGCLRLVKWHAKQVTSERIILEEAPLNELLAAINK